jgi:membrane protein DedA with SNARE-associated domain
MFYTTAGLVKYLSHFSYQWIVAYFGFFGYFLPIPDEGTFVVLGYLSGLGKFSFWLVFLSAISGILISDNIFYWLSVKESHHLFRFKKKIKEDILLKYEKLMEKNIGKTMLFLRLFIGFRFLGPVIAGSLKIKWRQFFLYDCLITVAYTGVFMSLGFVFRHRLPQVISFVEKFHSLLLSASAVLITFFLLRALMRKSG